MFNPNPDIQVLQLSNGACAYVIDNFCQKPDLWLTLALDNLALFRDAGSIDKVGYPGIELMMPEQINDALTVYFMEHIRRFTQTRRLIYSVSRLSLVTLIPSELRPAQCICHRDLARMPGGAMTASVLYLFDDPALGGTSFYAQKKSNIETKKLIDDSLSMTSLEFTLQYGIACQYMLDSNDWFEKIGSVPAKKNRVVFYSGDIFHSADITHADQLSSDPRTGRLTLNGFFYFTNKAA